mmetsp:Transcript_32252/g.67238  ORF Transcript_32252/g.67238 Transcript_32252/m.67238 type:complete len:298 (+) Transcript_32252:3570-4463(+)
MDDFEPTFKKFLTNYGIEDECKDVLKGFHIRDYPSLVKNQSNLRRFAERDANISLPSRDFPYTSKVLLSLVDYVSRFVTISPDEVLREIILKGPDFLNFLATGSSELASSYRIETKWKQEISGEVDDGKQWTSSQVDEIENDINLTNDELAALREFIRGKKWEYDLDNNTFYLPFEGQSKGFSLPARFFKILFDYQRDGIEWLLSGYSMKKNEVSGAIIADDMGLGTAIAWGIGDNHVPCTEKFKLYSNTPRSLAPKCRQKHSISGCDWDAHAGWSYQECAHHFAQNRCVQLEKGGQ